MVGGFFFLQWLEEVLESIMELKLEVGLEWGGKAEV